MTLQIICSPAMDAAERHIAAKVRGVERDNLDEDFRGTLVEARERAKDLAADWQMDVRLQACGRKETTMIETSIRSISILSEKDLLREGKKSLVSVGYTVAEYPRNRTASADNTDIQSEEEALATIEEIKSFLVGNRATGVLIFIGFHDGASLPEKELWIEDISTTYMQIAFEKDTGVQFDRSDVREIMKLSTFLNRNKIDDTNL